MRQRLRPIPRPRRSARRVCVPSRRRCRRLLWQLPSTARAWRHCLQLRLPQPRLHSSWPDPPMPCRSPPRIPGRLRAACEPSRSQPSPYQQQDPDPDACAPLQLSYAPLLPHGLLPLDAIAAPPRSMQQSLPPCPSPASRGRLFQRPCPARPPGHPSSAPSALSHRQWQPLLRSRPHSTWRSVRSKQSPCLWPGRSSRTAYALDLRHCLDLQFARQAFSL